MVKGSGGAGRKYGVQVRIQVRVRGFRVEVGLEAAVKEFAVRDPVS